MSRHYTTFLALSNYENHDSKVPCPLYSPSFFCTNGSMFQMLSAYSSMHLSLLKKPILATVKIAVVVHASVSLYDSSISS